MWKQRYRKTFYLNQAIILSICLALSLYWKMPLEGVVVFFAVMQLGALLGAMWTTRLVSKFDRARRGASDLPLSRSGPITRP